MVSGRVSHFTYRIQDQLLFLESFKSLVNHRPRECERQWKFSENHSRMLENNQYVPLETKHV